MTEVAWAHPRPTPYEAWRTRARAFLQRGVPPERVEWTATSLLAAHEAEGGPAAGRVRVPPALVDLLERAACHRDPAREPLMYRLLWRVVHGRPRLLDDAADDDVIGVRRLAKAVDRAVHKMRAFVRFRAVTVASEPRYVAWFEPEHRVLERNVPFFVDRFAGMHWTIVTPDGGVTWDREVATWFAVDRRVPLPQADAAEALWLTYYEHIFNPARLNVPMMRKEMPVGYWKNLPEAARIPALVASAMPRAGRMVEDTMTQDKRVPRAKAAGKGGDAPAHVASAAIGDDRASALPPAPSKADLDRCRRCPLGERATQGVPGAGPAHARLMLVGEQPGDEEDLAGQPFVGPAGKLLRRALAEAEVPADKVYITNAVKHFSFEVRGKRRIHKTPAQREIEACRGWLEAEIARERPAVIVALGATALFALLGKRVGVGAARGATLAHAAGARIVATYHPSAVLRDPTDEGKAERYRAIVSDLREAAELGRS